MAYTIANTHSASILDRALSFFADQRAAYAQRRLYTQTMNALKSMSTGELNDFGLSRSSLHDTAYAAVYG
jgi:uncharacterized protein YjiS (DUF1127 family)